MEKTTRYHPYKRRDNYENTSRQQIYPAVRRVENKTRQSARESEGQVLSHHDHDNHRVREDIHRDESSSSKALANYTVRENPLQREPLEIDKTPWKRR